VYFFRIAARFKWRLPDWQKNKFLLFAKFSKMHHFLAYEFEVGKSDNT
jgi:hypothetical protein